MVHRRVHCCQGHAWQGSFQQGSQGLTPVVCPWAALQDTAEFAKIGKYYAVESMLLWDPEQQRYLPDATPSYGQDTLEDFFRRVLKEGLAGQELGDAAVFGINKE